MAAMQLGQGMVRPGAWDRGGWLDRQYEIAKSVYALHYDISTFWSQHSIESIQDNLKIRALFVNTSIEMHSRWVTSTGAAMWAR